MRTHFIQQSQTDNTSNHQARPDLAESLTQQNQPTGTDVRGDMSAQPRRKIAHRIQRTTHVCNTEKPRLRQWDRRYLTYGSHLGYIIKIKQIAAVAYMHRET